MRGELIDTVTIHATTIRLGLGQQAGRGPAMSRGEAPARPPPWYDVAFDDLYAELYAHRDQAEAVEAVTWLRPGARPPRARHPRRHPGPGSRLRDGPPSRARSPAPAPARWGSTARGRSCGAPGARRKVAERGSAPGEIALVQGDLRAPAVSERRLPRRASACSRASATSPTKPSMPPCFKRSAACSRRADGSSSIS